MAQVSKKSLNSTLTLEETNLVIEEKQKRFSIFWKKNRAKIIPLIILIGYLLLGFVGSVIWNDPDFIYIQKSDGELGTNLSYPAWLEFLYRKSPLYGTPYMQFSDLPLGTNGEGKSWFTILVHALKNSLIIGIIAGLLCVVLAVLIGIIGPFIGGIVDDALVLITNIFLVFPVIPFIILLSTTFQTTKTWHIVLVIALFNWPWAARSIRSQVLSLKERDFVKISRITGQHPIKIAFVDVLPNMFSYIFLVFTILINVAILTEAGIAIIGIGQTENWTLGRMLDVDRVSHVTPGYFHLWIPTGLFLTSFLVLMYVINTNWQDIFNPRLRES
ncbi:hypothetical protein NEF87_002325 [Candidatus Lokiarchaeum ossiferum]|uniref:ABC transmembrane type-1 domain-containing protein n=1 Tax=Candidatus Lokiarchaeum ossiferum TaxID=2951803 RepID=A0ABY6HRL0_9ARCH|nr:hypothetical protein NEF87_002325 [Candidatus Lokiarchaeum sp. B-35]